jgi:hypothetical protein
MPNLEVHLVLRFVILIFTFIGPRHLFCGGEQIEVAHLSINRRGGAVAQHEPANLTQLVQLLHDTEGRYARAKREVKGNKLVRRWRARSTGATNDEQLVAEPGQDGSWCVD